MNVNGRGASAREVLGGRRPDGGSASLAQVSTAAPWQSGHGLLRLVLVLALAVAGCGETRLLGRSCADADCQSLSFSPPPGCGVQLSLPRAEVMPGAELDRCELFTLDALAGWESGGAIYVTGAEAMMMPGGHHLDVRAAPAVDGFDDGPVDCMELWARRVAWVPLMATQGESDTWDFASAPLIASGYHRVLVDDHFVNTSPEPVELDVRLNLSCMTTRPASVSQAFEFSNREPAVVYPGQRREVGGSCAFQKPVVVSRLYTWTHLITSFSVRRMDSQQPLWQSSSMWTVDFAAPLAFAADEGFHWDCVYDNSSDMPFTIGGTSPDACSLLGIYRLASGGEDAQPERCTL